MKLHFEDDLDYQQAAVAAVVDLFKGQEISRSEFTVTMQHKSGASRLGMDEQALGVGNRLQLVDDEILENLHNIQKRNKLKPSETLVSGDFTVEMETGTGKTYVYLRTIFELNQNYGFSKFVIVVPSVAIKEGTFKTLQITQEHFENIYPKAKGYDFFLYDGSKPDLVRNFATSSNIQIMVVTAAAINKAEKNNIYKEQEGTGGEKPIDLIRATNPILFVDEPQSVDGGLNGKGKQALEKMNPLCTLRYSATHIDQHHKVYRLDAVDAYEKGLVKQIEVASLEIEDGFNKPYVKLMGFKKTKSTCLAVVELDVQKGKKISRIERQVKDGDDLEQVTGRSLYENIQIGTIDSKAERMELKGNGFQVDLGKGQSHGGINDDAMKRLMIQRTIKEHLDKEKRFAEQDKKIKVLSLFFIDSVEHYRSYDEDGQPVMGKYAQMFEEEYRKLGQKSEYQPLFSTIDVDMEVSEIHDGYFSIDKKVVTPFSELQLKKSSTKEAVETSSYNLIMKEKERLLSFDTKLKFIFSHSALKEGWDNPNVFQICSLRDMGSDRERRQTIGRGMRLCVNQDGERLRGFDINTLTVTATESYQDFADRLQKEYEKDTGIRFGIVEKHQFSHIQVKGEDDLPTALGFETSEKIWSHLEENGLISSTGKVQDKLRTMLKKGSFTLPDELQVPQEEVVQILKKLAGKLDVKNANERHTITTRQAVLESEAFKALWDRIKHKTTYRVDFDNEKLITDCATAIRKSPPITKTRAKFRKADMSIGKGGIEGKETSVSSSAIIESYDAELPDILTDLQDKTQLTRRSIVKILKGSDRLYDFKCNPQLFIDQATEAINRTKQLALVDGIKYQRLGVEDYYAQELFDSEELTGYLKNTIETQKSVFKEVVYDSIGTEKSFAEDLEKNEAVKVYAKLPSWFKIPTPLGTYNPDWAVLIEEDGRENLYFVVETKSSNWWDDLRYKEGAKIACGEAHFKAIATDKNPAQYIKATSVNDMIKYSEGQ